MAEVAQARPAAPITNGSNGPSGYDGPNGSNGLNLARWMLKNAFTLRTLASLVNKRWANWA